LPGLGSHVLCTIHKELAFSIFIYFEVQPKSFKFGFPLFIFDLPYFYQSWMGIIYIFDTHQIWFSQNRLQKVSILKFEFFWTNLYTGLGYQYFYKKNLTNSHTNSNKFENSWSSFDGSHEPVIIIFSNKKIKITDKLLILFFLLKIKKSKLSVKEWKHSTWTWVWS